MQCPKCNSEMEVVQFESVEVDRCTGCQGIWFDQFEVEDLKKMKGSEVIDCGDPKVGAQQNTNDHINCPKCHTPMIRMVDNQQPHIWYEGCVVCYGLFFDAGEFKDYKKETILDFFKDLRTKERH
ncbi:MAG: zf-TFIIB domain-containing protein [Pontiellaceae bacterium]|nr:zf-TFIIB domain-containing protein [Pontiellaceae bacterium]